MTASMATPTAVHEGVVPYRAATSVRPSPTEPTTAELAPQNGSPDSTRAGAAQPRPVVAVVLERRGHILLLKRSAQVTHDQGKWHCITGYIETGRSAVLQAIDELFEETGLRLVDLISLEAGPVLSICDAAGQPWQVHTFNASTLRKRLTLNWEHDTYRWVHARRLRKYDGRVPWLDTVVGAAGQGDGPRE
jgi:8-oxo-dGTP pyrophosphatase MutT (NUDIX family)